MSFSYPAAPRILHYAFYDALAHKAANQSMTAAPEARFLTSADRPEQFLPDDGAEVAFAGRSNSGKSSAINAILHRRNLARTSKTPGRTQLINFFGLGARQRLVDLPGYGFARVPRASQDHWRELLDAYFTRRRSLAGLFLIVDARRGLVEFDQQMLAWMAGMGQPVHVLLTKCDKLSREASTRLLEAAKPTVGEANSAQLFSARTGDGVNVARQRLDEMLTGSPPGR